MKTILPTHTERSDAGARIHAAGLGASAPSPRFRPQVRHAHGWQLRLSSTPGGAGASRRARFPGEVPGWLTADEGLALYYLALGRRVLEVGSYCGRSTACMGQAAVHVHAVDSFEYLSPEQPPRPCLSVRERFFRTLRDYGLESRVTLVQQRFDEGALHALPGPFDLEFIDADHGYETTAAQASLALGLLREGSVIAFHDYGRWPGVTRAVNERWGRSRRRLVGKLMVIEP